MAPTKKVNQCMVLKQQQLKDLEKSLSKIMDTLDQEINQTDVEWLNLKSVIMTSASKDLIEKKPFAMPEPKEKEQQPKVNVFTLLKPEPQLESEIDNFNVHELDLDLSLGNLNHPSVEEDSDSD